MLEFKFDTQLLVDGNGIDEDAVYDYIANNIKGDCLLVIADDDTLKLHYHTNYPWQVLEYCSNLGELYDVVVENMERQEKGLKG